MKRLITMITMTTLAVVVQAATVDWNSGVVFGPSDKDGTISAKAAYKLADTSTAAMYVFILADSTEYAKVQSSGVYATYNTKLSSADASTTKLSSSKFEALTTGDYSASENVYAALLFTYTDTSGKQWYLENTATVTIDDLGSSVSLNNLARYQGGAQASGQLGSWGSVPEPTSGLLLALGFAGLALRRRRA